MIMMKIMVLGFAIVIFSLVIDMLIELENTQFLELIGKIGLVVAILGASGIIWSLLCAA